MKAVQKGIFTAHGKYSKVFSHARTYACAHTHTHTHIHTHTHTHTHLHKHTHTHTLMYMNVFVCIYMHTQHRNLLVQGQIDTEGV